MTLKSQIDLWSIIANYLNTNQKSLDTAARHFSCGQPFFTTMLPSLGKDLEAGLTGRFVLSVDTPFKAKRGSNLPVFLNEHFKKIFYNNGYIRPDPVGIADLRFLLKVFYKFEHPLTPQGVKDAEGKFKDTDCLVKTDQYPYGLSEVRKNFMSLFPEFPRDIRPHHAGGATSMRYSNCEKRFVRHNIPSLMGVYGPEFFFNTQQHAIDWCAVNKTTVTDAYPRVTFVPKDARGPRTISIFHHMVMQIQKGLQDKLYEFTEKGYSPARGYINFTDQEINQRLAYQGSIDGSIATIDLKDASDLVPWNLVKMLCPESWYDALASTRTDVVMISGCEFPVKKYVSMGSALCFPIEAFVFWSIAKTVSPWVYVYGDDIVVPNEKAQDVIAALESYGLIVNHQKTLTHGHFRESCGGDFYNGLNINYTSCKSDELENYIAFCNEVADRHSQSLAEDLMAWYEESYQVIVYRMPVSMKCRLEPHVFYTDHVAASSAFFKRRYNTDLQREEVLRHSIVSSTAKHKKSRRKGPKAARDGFTATDYDWFFEWLTMNESSTSPTEDAYYVEKISGTEASCFRPLIYRREPWLSMPGIRPDRTVKRQDTSPDTKYVWGPVGNG